MALGNKKTNTILRKWLLSQNNLWIPRTEKDRNLIYLIKKHIHSFKHNYYIDEDHIYYDKRIVFKNSYHAECFFILIRSTTEYETTCTYSYIEYIRHIILDNGDGYKGHKELMFVEKNQLVATYSTLSKTLYLSYETHKKVLSSELLELDLAKLLIKKHKLDVLKADFFIKEYSEPKYKEIVSGKFELFIKPKKLPKYHIKETLFKYGEENSSRIIECSSKEEMIETFNEIKNTWFEKGSKWYGKYETSVLKMKAEGNLDL